LKDYERDLLDLIFTQIGPAQPGWFEQMLNNLNYEMNTFKFDCFDKLFYY